LSAVLFDEFLADPVFVLTADQDWAPEWALEAMLELVAADEIPLHLFVTNESPALRDRLPASASLGIHPNFLPGSSHGSTDDEVIANCLELVPGATSFRCHAHHENSRILFKLADYGLRAGSNPLCFLQPGLLPLIQGTGLLRFPVVLEDDIFLHWAQPSLDTTLALRMMLTPGIKVLDFHPSLVALNAPSLDYYTAHRDSLYGCGRRRCAPYPGRGVATVLAELIHAVKHAGHGFVSFTSLVDRAYDALSAAFPGGLYGWGPAFSTISGRPDHSD
jgi:hypothetical protein